MRACIEFAIRSPKPIFKRSRFCCTNWYNSILRLIFVCVFCDWLWTRNSVIEFLYYVTNYIIFTILVTNVILPLLFFRLKDLGGGTILDIGIYCIQFATFVFGSRRPDEIIALGHLNEHGVDESMNAIFKYDDGKMATLTSHSRIDLPNEGIIIGTKGTIRVRK